MGDHESLMDVLSKIHAERHQQDEKWGEQNHPDGTGIAFDDLTARLVQERCQEAFSEGKGTWRLILHEEMAEAFAETDPDKLEAELIQAAAVCVAWVQSIRRRKS